MRRRCWTWMALALVPGCAGKGDVPDATRTASTSDQAAALEALETESHSEWSASFDGKSGAASHLEGRLEGALLPGAKPADAALKFLSNHKQIFRMNAPEQELVVRRERNDALGMQHVRFGQQVGGIPVSGAEMFVHFRQDGSLATVDSTYVPDLTNVNLTPAFDGEEALQLAIGDFGSTRPKFRTGQFWKKPIVELVVFPTSSGPRLAYHVRLHVRSIDPSHMDYMIDASTRAVIRKYENLQTAAPSTPTTGTGKTSDNVTVNLAISEDNGNFTLEDMTRTAKGIRTFTYNNQPDTTCSNDMSADGCLEQWLNAHPNGTLVASTNKDAWDATGTNKGSAVEAHLYAGYVYDYYKTKFGRNGIDGMDMEIQSNVHFANSYANAFWDGIGMVYGDGDGIQLKLTTKGYDVIAHELTHGVTEHESGLEYHDQPGALNESLSDVMSSFAEHVSFPDPVNNWYVGEKVAGFLLGTKLRDMMDPGSVTLSPQPDNMSKYSTATDDNGGVHTNSGIPNNAAYLMTIGGTNKTSKIVVSGGIGWEKAEQVWYRAATEYFGATTDFKGAAQGTLTAAADLGYSDAVKATIECAWIAVGVITSPSACRVVTDDGGVITPEAGPVPEGGGSIEGGAADARPDTTTRDGGVDVTVDSPRPTTDAPTGADTTTSSDAGAKPDATSTTPDADSDAGTPGADSGAAGSGGAGGNGSGTGGSAGTSTPPTDNGCNCRVPGERAPTRSTAGLGAVLALVLAGVRRRTRKAA